MKIVARENLVSNQRKPTPILFALVPGLSDADMVSLLPWLEHWNKLLLGILILAAAWAVVRTTVDLSRWAAQKGTMPYRRILLRVVGLLMIAFLAHQGRDLYQLYVLRIGIGLLLSWFAFVVFTAYVFCRYGRPGMVAAIAWSLGVLVWLFSRFFPAHPEYSIAPGWLVAAVLFAVVLIVARTKNYDRFRFGATYWIVLIVFFSVFLSPMARHASVRLEKDPLRFGAATVIPSTLGLQVEKLLVSENGSTLFFLTNDRDKGIGHLTLPNGKPEFFSDKKTEFRDLIHLEGRNIIAASVKSGGIPMIALFTETPFKPAGRFTLPSSFMGDSSIEKLSATKDWLFASARSPEQGYLVVCPSKSDSDAIDGPINLRCLHYPLEDAKTPGVISASDKVKRLLIGGEQGPFGIHTKIEEWVPRVLKKRRTINIGRGALEITYGRDNYFVYLGRPLSSGIEVAEGEGMTLVRILDGPFAVSTICEKTPLLAAGSYLEGEVVLYNIRQNKKERLFVGPRVSDIDYHKGNRSVYVATGNGIVKIDLRLLFGEKVFW